MEEKQKPLKWRDLKVFANTLNDEQLDVPVLLLNVDETPQQVMDASGMEEDIYQHKEDEEDCAGLIDLKYAHGEKFNQDDYKLVTPKGTPFLFGTTYFED